jgi:hypothetical protein
MRFLHDEEIKKVTLKNSNFKQHPHKKVSFSSLFASFKNTKSKRTMKKKKILIKILAL